MKTWWKFKEAWLYENRFQLVNYKSFINVKVERLIYTPTFIIFVYHKGTPLLGQSLYYLTPEEFLKRFEEDNEQSN